MSKLVFLLGALCVLCQALHVNAFAGRGMLSKKFQVKTSHILPAKPTDKVETDDEIRERLRQKVRKNLYSDKGVAYAPWVTNQIDEDVSQLTNIRICLHSLPNHITPHS